METNIDCMKYRTSTHLASVDVEAMIAEKGSCILTIKLAFYNTNEPVNGKGLDGYFIKFEEPVKDMKVNSGNRRKISNQVKAKLNCTPVESRNLTNWVGQKVKFLVDPKVKFGKEVTGGIVVDESYIVPEKPTLEINTESFNKAKIAVEAGTFDLAKLKTYYIITDDVRIALNL